MRACLCAARATRSCTCPRSANQEGYLEEALKLPSALREFEQRPNDTAPAIVGFREHIFSGLGALGAFAASSEMVFGGLAQRTMADVLQSRYHYGHPDLLDKCKLMAQGGISKATRGLSRSSGHLRTCALPHLPTSCLSVEMPCSCNRFVGGHLCRHGLYASRPSRRSSRVLCRW